MVNTEQYNASMIANTRSEAGMLRDELGYQRSLQHQCGYTLLSLRVAAYLEFGIDLRCNEEPVLSESC